MTFMTGVRVSQGCKQKAAAGEQASSVWDHRGRM
jgi:hypothetical protein